MTDGGSVAGVVVNEEDGDGLITIQTERPINGKLVNSFTRAELDAMTSAKTEDALVEGEVKDDAAQSTGDGTDAEIQPVGKSVLGSLFDQFRGRAKDAVKFLLNRKEGSAVGALHHKDVGDIDLWYGNEQAGLLKIAEKHPEVLEDLQGIIDGMHVVQASENRVILESDTHKAVVSKDWYGKKIDNWLLTAYEKKNGASGGSIDIVPEPSGMQNGTAPLQDTSLSAGKGSVDSANEQEKVAEDADAMPMVVVDGREKPDFSRATPERAHAYVYNERGLSRENADAFVENNINASASELEALRSEKPEMGTDLDEFDEAMSSWQSKIDAARRKHDYWQSVKDVQSGIVAAGAELQRRRDIAASEEGAQGVEQAGTGVSGEQERGPVRQGGRVRLDAQGNGLDAQGRIVTERVSSVSELTDADFTQPVRSVELDGVPTVVREAIGAGEKPVVIKKNIFEKNARDHGDLTPEQSREILNAALYDADLYGRNKPTSKPYNWVVINTKDAEGKNRLVLLEVNDNKDNVEVVHWHYLDNRGLDKIKRQAAREGGQILMLPSEEEAGALSSRTHGLSSAGKGSDVSVNEQGSVEKSEDAGSSLAVSGRDGGSVSERGGVGKFLGEVWRKVASKFGGGADRGHRAASNITEQPIVTSDAASDATGDAVEHSAASSVREQKSAGVAREVSADERMVVEALADELNAMGIRTHVATEEGQRVLDAANGGVTLSRGQKRALETVSDSQSENHLQTVVSSADGAKVLQNLESLANEIENSVQTPVKTFLGNVAKALGARRQGSGSEYATFETKNGRVVTIRLANHNASVSTFDKHGEDDGISIVISPKKSVGIDNDGGAHIVEFYYDSIKLRRADGKPLASIVRSIEQALYSGEYKDTTGLAEREEVNLGDVRLQMAAPVFYSNALRAVEGIRQDKATPAQWLAMIQKQGSLKAGEDKWLGLSEWLKGSDAKTLTKQEVLDFIRENEVQVEEKEYSEAAIDAAHRYFTDVDNYEFDFTSDAYDEIERRYGLTPDDEYDYIPNTNFEFFGDDESRLEMARRVNDNANFINESAYDFEDEDDVELFIREVETEIMHDIDNWIQEPAESDDENTIDEIRLEYTTKGLKNKREIALTVPTIAPWRPDDKVHFGDAGNGRAVAWVRFGETRDSAGNRVLVIDEIQSNRHQEARKKVKTDIPDAPFEKNWHELAMKRMLRLAAEEGFDKVAWTTGAQQADRYDLTKVIEEIAYWKEGENYAISAGDKHNTQKIDQQTFTPQELVETFGREIADKIINDEGSFDSILGYPEDSSVHYLNGETIKVGGEGMKGFYDQMLPSFMNKYGKKWGAQVGTVELPDVEEAARTMWSVDVTPEMRDSVMDGQPMFFRTAGGEAYGFTLGGEIYLDGRIATRETPVHEYAHLWAEALRESNPVAWEALKERIVRDEHGLYEYVKSLYPELEGDALMEEVFAHFAGRRGKARLDTAQREEMAKADGVFSKARVVTMFANLRDLLKDFWNMARDLFAGQNARLADVTAEDFADMAVADMLGGFNPMRDAMRGAMDARDAEYARLADVVEKPARIEKLRRSEPVIVDFKNEYPLQRKPAKEWLKANIKGEYTNEDTGDKISVSNYGIDKVTSHGEREEAHLMSFVAIPQMIEKSIFITERENEKGNEKYDSYRYYVCGLKIGGEDYTAKLVVGVKNGRRYYDHELTQIEKGELLDGLNGIAKPVAENNSPVSVGKDRRLFEILQVNAQEIADAESRMREILDEVKAERGYVSESDFRVSHAAPNGSDGYSKSIANPDGIYPEDLYSPQGYRYYGDGDVTMDMASADVFKRLRGNPDALVKVYRAVPDSLQETGIRNGDWVSINRRYAQEHGERHIDGGFKILEEEVPAKFVYTDGNSLHEQGYDDGKGYAYKDVANNRKLDDLITRDDSGRLILPSERFNDEVSDVRYHKSRRGRETGDLSAVNARFNAELERWEQGLLPSNSYLSVGSPMGVLSNFMSSNPIVLRQRVLTKALKKHGLEVSDVRNLPLALSRPVFVFQSSPSTISVLTELQTKDGKHVFVAIELDASRQMGHEFLEVNDVLTIHDRDTENIVKPIIENDSLLWVDKDKGHRWLSSAKSNSQAITNDDLKSAAKVIEDFENPSVSGEKSSDLAEMRSVAEQLGERLHTPLRIVEDVQEIVHPDAEVQARMRGARGWFNPATGEVVVVLPNNRDAADVASTVGHEVIGHKGLRELIGAARYNEFLDETYRHLHGDLKEGVDAAAGRAFVDDATNNGKRAKSYEQHRRTAVDELFGRLAEKPFDEFSQGERTLWQRIKEAVRRLLDRFLGTLKLPDGFEIGENELRYMLWRSKERMERGKESPIDVARDIVKREELGFDDVVFSRDFRMNSGYDEREDGTYISVRAKEAEEEGTFTKGTFQKKYGVSRRAFALLEMLGIIKKTEWHHTGKSFKESDYYSWADSTRANGNMDYSEARCEEGSLGAVYADNKKEIERLAKEYESKDLAFGIKESLVYVPPFEDFLYDRFKAQKDDFLTEQEKDSRRRRHSLISEGGSELGTSHDRYLMHTRIDEEYDKIARECFESEASESLREEYDAQYGDVIRENEAKEERNASLQERNMETDGREKPLMALMQLFGADAQRAYDKAMALSEIEVRSRREAQEREERERRSQRYKDELLAIDAKREAWLKKQLKAGKVTFRERLSSKPEYFLTTKEEMNGRYGWFEATSRYNMPVYYSGYEFSSKRLFDNYGKFDEEKAAVWRAASDEGVYLFRDGGETLDEVNSRFNEELEKFTEETADKINFNLGNPSSILVAAGVEDRPIRLHGSKVAAKMRKHGFEASELRDLPQAVADPLAVFDNLGREGNRSVLTELKTAQGNFLVTIDLGKGVEADFDVVSSVFGKRDGSVLDWINKGYLRYVNKEKALDYLYLSAPIAEASANQELESAAKVIEDFVNPSVSGEKSSESDAESAIRALDSRYNGKEMVFVDLNDDVSILQAFEAHISAYEEELGERLNDEERKGIAEFFRDEFNKTLGSFDSKTGKIFIFAENIPSVRIEETYFHENIHAQLHDKYGDGISESDVVNHFWENAPKSGGVVERSFIERKYEVAKQKEEFFATWLGKAMVQGRVDELLSMLSDAGDRNTVEQILNNIGYDRAREKAIRSEQGENTPLLGESERTSEYRPLSGRGGEVAGEDFVSPDGGDVSNVRGVSDSDFTPRDRAIARDLYERMVSTGGYAFQESVQDSMLGLKRFYQAVLGKDTRIEDVPGFENAYLAENRMSSITAAEQYEFYVRFMKPLLSAIGKLVGTSESARVELIDYMMAKHGLERNEVMARRDFEAYVKKYPSGTKTFDKFRSRDYAGLTALSGKIQQGRVNFLLTRPHF